MQTKHLTLDLHPGVCIWMRPGHIYDARQNESDALGITYLHFSLQDGAQRHYPEFYELWNLDYLDSITHRIVDLMTQPEVSPAMWQAANALLSGLLQDLVTNFQRRDAPERQAPVPRHQKHLMQQIARYIHDTADSTLTVQDLARKAGYSLAHFSSLFKKHTGQTVEAMIIRARIDKAQQLLRWSDCSISEIADQTGYRDVYFFSRQFKAKTGQTPSQYRAASGENE
jgi:YesN/AraC family two-component response regulator